jgi:Holliday junction resolvasome RuvABC ATP-dependent DNA helicase subunit
MTWVSKVRIAGIQAIAHTMNVPPDTLEDEVEPFLLRCGLIQRTPRGRVITAEGHAHLELFADRPLIAAKKKKKPDKPDSEEGRLLF